MHSLHFGGFELICKFNATLNMRSIKETILRYVRVRRFNGPYWSYSGTGSRNVLKQLSRQMCASTSANPDEIMRRVIALVKKFDKTDAQKVTETADFQKDLSLDSLDRVELVMAFEEEFSIEIPEEKADKLTCCADVARYIASEAGEKQC